MNYSKQTPHRIDKLTAKKKKERKTTKSNLDEMTPPDIPATVKNLTGSLD